jgi:PDDEXK-like domain of unknown function (DUF3799)
MSIDKPGFYPNIPEAEYHSDPVANPSASASILHTLYSRSPMHAYHRHPKLNPAYKPSKSTPAQAFGKAAHALAFGADNIREIDAADWRTKDAKEARASIEAAGGIALLSKDMIVAKNMVHTLRSGLKSHAVGDVFADGEPETTIVWKDDGAWLRGRIDWWKPKQNLVVDYKTTEGSADPEQWSRNLFQLGSDFQGVLYPQGVAAITKDARPRFLYIVQEVDPPHAFSVLDLDEAAREFTTNRVAQAFHVWRDCLAKKKWPGYPPHICHVAAPVWAVKRDEEKALAASSMAEIAATLN